VKLTNTQLVLLSAASQRDDRVLERPPSLVGGAAGKVVARLLTEGLIEEIPSRGSLHVWRRNETGASPRRAFRPSGARTRRSRERLMSRERSRPHHQRNSATPATEGARRPSKPM
jgi:hypothetical protein